jgi:hypothetical protein
MLANFLGVLPILISPLCALAFILRSNFNLGEYSLWNHSKSFRNAAAPWCHGELVPGLHRIPKSADAGS